MFDNSMTKALLPVHYIDTITMMFKVTAYIQYATFWEYVQITDGV